MFIGITPLIQTQLIFFRFMRKLLRENLEHHLNLCITTALIWGDYLFRQYMILKISKSEPIDVMKRYQIVFTTSSGATNGRIGFTAPQNPSGGAYFWGMQLEKGNGATPYIYTYSSML